MNNQCKTTHYIGCDCYEEAQQKTITELREAIAAWPNTYFHSAKCLKFEECTCGVREAKLARMYARRVAGLEEP